MTCVQSQNERRQESGSVMVCVGVWLEKTFTRYVNATRFKYEIN